MNEAELSYLGTPIIGGRLPNAPANLDTSCTHPRRHNWEKATNLTTNKRLEYPLALADEYTLNGETPLDGAPEWNI